MSEEDLRIQQIKMKIKGLTFEQARDISNLCSEYYIEGLEKGRFDRNIDLYIDKASIPEELRKDKTFMELFDMPSYEDLIKEKQDFIKWLESKNQFHYKNGKIEDNYILVSEVLNKVRGDR